jgi:hypothetical protein
MSSDPKEICIKGFIIAERHASPHIVKIVSEILQNSMEANRLARLAGAEETVIKVQFYFQSSIFSSLVVSDFASHSSGIINIESKQIFSLYNHVGENDGFSEFGIGGKQSCMQLGNRIEYKTKSNSTHGALLWNINEILTGNKKNHFDSITSVSSSLDIKFPFSTGTKLSIEDLCSKFKSQSVSSYLMSMGNNESSFREDICKSFVSIENNEKIIFEFVKDGNHLHDLDIVLEAKTNIKDHIEEHQLVVCRKNELYTTYVEHEDSYYELYDDIKRLTHDHTKPKRDKFKKNLFELKNKKQLNENDVVGRATLCLSTETETLLKDDKIAMNKHHATMGFDTHRRVAGGSIVKTNITPLSLQWNKFSSHRTRFTRFRGAIVYDKRLDSIVQTDKCKTVSDDRAFEPSFRYTILQLTNDYFTRMKKKGFYDTETKEGELNGNITSAEEQCEKPSDNVSQGMPSQEPDKIQENHEEQNTKDTVHETSVQADAVNDNIVEESNEHDQNVDGKITTDADKEDMTDDMTTTETITKDTKDDTIAIDKLDDTVYNNNLYDTIINENNDVDVENLACEIPIEDVHSKADNQKNEILSTYSEVHKEPNSFECSDTLSDSASDNAMDSGEHIDDEQTCDDKQNMIAQINTLHQHIVFMLSNDNNRKKLQDYFTLANENDINDYIKQLTSASDMLQSIL